MQAHLFCLLHLRGHITEDVEWLVKLELMSKTCIMAATVGKMSCEPEQISYKGDEIKRYKIGQCLLF